MAFRIFGVIAVALVPATAVVAAETVSYTYDAQGRLIQVVKSGSVNNGATVQYTYDKAGNRVRVIATGSPNG